MTERCDILNGSLILKNLPQRENVTTLEPTMLP
jgi:hypothetical protein